MKTIKQIADDLGVSKTAIRKRLTPEFKEKYTETANGMIVVSQEGETLITQSIQKSPETLFPETFRKQFPETTGNVSGAFAVLQEQIRVKDELISGLTAELNTERNHSRGQADKITELAEKLATLTSNAQLLHGESRGMLPSTADAPKSGRWDRLKAAWKGE